MREQSEISRHRPARAARHDERARGAFDASVSEEARVVAKALVDALADILRSERG